MLLTKSHPQASFFRRIDCAAKQRQEFQIESPGNCKGKRLGMVLSLEMRGRVGLRHVPWGSSRPLLISGKGESLEGPHGGAVWFAREESPSTVWNRKV